MSNLCTLRKIKWFQKGAYSRGKRCLCPGRPCPARRIESWSQPKGTWPALPPVARPMPSSAAGEATSTLCSHTHWKLRHHPRVGPSPVGTTDQHKPGDRPTTGAAPMSLRRFLVSACPLLCPTPEGLDPKGWHQDVKDQTPVSSAFQL